MMGGPIELLTMVDKVSKEPKSLGEIFRAQAQCVLEAAVE